MARVSFDQTTPAKTTKPARVQYRPAGMTPAKAPTKAPAKKSSAETPAQQLARMRNTFAQGQQQNAAINPAMRAGGQYVANAYGTNNPQNAYAQRYQQQANSYMGGLQNNAYAQRYQQQAQALAQQQAAAQAAYAGRYNATRAGQTYGGQNLMQQFRTADNKSMQGIVNLPSRQFVDPRFVDADLVDWIDYSTQEYEKWDPNTTMNPDGSPKTYGGGGYSYGGGGGGGGGSDYKPEWYEAMVNWRI